MASKTIARHVCGLTAWFRIPEQGMANYEVLSQASAVLLRHRRKNLLLTSAHVVAPWDWRHYFPQDWISFVAPEHCRYTLEVRDQASGAVVKTVRLDAATLESHPSRDVAKLCLGAEVEKDLLLAPASIKEGEVVGGEGADHHHPSQQQQQQQQQQHCYGMRPVELARDELSLWQPVAVAGHSVIEHHRCEGEGGGVGREVDLEELFGDAGSEGSDVDDDDDDDDDDGLRPQMPQVFLDCSFCAHTGPQTFVQTPEVLVDGMCGGGIFTFLDDGDSGSGSGDGAAVCHGIVEGIVPANTPHDLAGCAAFVEAAELRAWLATAAPCAAPDAAPQHDGR